MKTPKQVRSDIPLSKRQKDALFAFQKKLGSLTFLDPACGSGNFLTETYLSLRKLENECIKLRLGGESVLDVMEEEFSIQVNIDHFYGIEINDFAVSVAKTALWIAENIAHSIKEPGLPPSHHERLYRGGERLAYGLGDAAGGGPETSSG